MAEALTLALAAGGLQAVWVADPAWACGCGAMIPGSGGTMSVSREQAVVRFDGTTEDVVMRFSVQSSAAEAAWVMPVPGPATVKLADKALFGDLAAEAMPIERVHRYFWPHLDFGGSSPNGRATGRAPESAAQPPVQVLSDQQIGEFEVADLASADPKALGTWLRQHSFALKDSTAARLASYTDQGWQFVAVRLAAAGSASLDGALDPIRISFAAESAVYPMRLSAGATTPQTVGITVLAPHRMDVSRTPVAGQDAVSSFGDWVDPSKVGAALASLAGTRMFRTDYDSYYGQPSQITQDYAFTPAPSDWVQHPTYDKEELLTFLGIPVYLFVLAAPAVGVAVLVRRLSARTRSRATPAPR